MTECLLNWGGLINVDKLLFRGPVMSYLLLSDDELLPWELINGLPATGPNGLPNRAGHHDLERVSSQSRENLGSNRPFAVISKFEHFSSFHNTSVHSAVELSTYL